MTWYENLVIYGEAMLVVGLFVAAIFYAFSKARKQQAAEVHALAETRGQVIVDLRDQVESLRQEVAELRGALASVQNQKAEDIARKTAEQLKPFLRYELTSAVEDILD